jgi:hypothetical protein
MNSYNDVLMALGEGKTIQSIANIETSEYCDRTQKEVLIAIAEELIRPSWFRIKPKVSWEEELWLNVRKDATISFSALSEFVEALKVELSKAPDSEGWFNVPSDWKQDRCPTDIPLDTRIEVEYRREGYEIDKICNFSKEFWYQEGHDFDIIRYRVI